MSSGNRGRTTDSQETERKIIAGNRRDNNSRRLDNNYSKTGSNSSCSSNSSIDSRNNIDEDRHSGVHHSNVECRTSEFSVMNPSFTPPRIECRTSDFTVMNPSFTPPRVSRNDVAHPQNRQMYKEDVKRKTVLPYDSQNVSRTISSGYGSSCSTMTGNKSRTDRPDKGRSKQGSADSGEIDTSIRLNDSSSSSKTVVDNEKNRKLNRVGLPIGSAPETRSASDETAKSGPASVKTAESQSTSSKQSSSSKPYVDNEKNRKLNRVGLPIGTAPETRSASDKTAKSQPASVKTAESQSSLSKQRSDAMITSQFAAMSLNGQKVYKDNILNRKLGRVGQPLGSMKYNPRSKAHSVYVDNDYNRRYNRVGKPLGSVPIPPCEKVYKDSLLNRQLDRVGLPWGTCKRKKQNELLTKLKKLNMEEDVSEDIISKYEQGASAKDTILQFFETTNREQILKKHLEEGRKTAWNPHQHTSKQLAETYKGNVIKCQDLNFQQQIGHGSFGKVFMAIWNEGEVLAIKVLKKNKTSKQREFAKEILLYCQLEHDNVVQFIGACNELPHLAIVMEYMDMSLKEAIHTEQVDFLEEERLSIMKDIANGLDYLHSKGISHCDLKPGNVLLNNIPGADTTDPQMPVIAKLTDFGLSLWKTESDTGPGNAEKVKSVGTPRYSAPEVLRGELLDIDQMMKADIYSLGLTVFELLLEIDPFEELDRSELKEKVGIERVQLRMKNEHIIEDRLKSFLLECRNFLPKNRPTVHSCSVFFKRCQSVYVQLKRNR